VNQTKLHPLFTAYLSHLERRGRDHKTIERNRYSLVRLDEWLRNAGVEPPAATEVLLEEYVSHLGMVMAETTSNRETTHVKAAYRYAVRLAMIEKSPAENLETPKVTEVEPEVFSYEELRRIRAAIQDDLDEAIFYGLAYGGLRRFELVNLTRAAVDFSGQFMTVRGKGGKLRRVPLHPLLADVFVNHTRGSRAETVLGRGGSLRNVNKRVENLLKRAAIDGGNRPAHRFRKTVATVLYEEGVQTDVIDRIMAWVPQSIRGRYYTRIKDEAMYQAILKLYTSDPIERLPSPPLDEPREIRKAG
jgi:integrase/recombinase XerD